MYVLFSDTDCDLTPSLCKELGYNLMSMPYTIDDKDVYPYVDFEQFNDKEFYDTLRNGVLPKTSALNPVDYVKYFEPFLKDGKDVLYVHFSKAMSGTFNALNLAIEELKEKYPNNTVCTIDTKGISALSLLIAKEVAKLYKEGKSMQEILDWANTEVDKYSIYFYADNLKFFKLSGRVSGIAATMGAIFDIRPVIHVNLDGKMATLAKARGKKATLNKILQFVEENEQDIASHPVVIGHSDALDTAKLLAQLLQEKYGQLDISYTAINPTIGSHCGPDCVGVAFYTKGRLA